METLTLTAPDPVQAVAVGQTTGLTSIAPQRVVEIEAQARKFVSELLGLHPGSPDFTMKADQLNAIGQREIRNATGQSNRFLDKPVRAMEAGVGSELVKLRSIIESLDPGRNRILEPRRLLGLIPFGSKLQGYFDRYRSSQAHIGAILRNLAKGKDELLMDNATIEGERRRMWTSMGLLQEKIHLARTLDTQLETETGRLDAHDPVKARTIRQDALFPVRRRTQDLLEQMAVTMQGYMALDLIRKNNDELVRGVDRASTTTVSALRTAVTVAQALGTQRLVLDQINALNATTSSLVEGTSRLMRDQSARISEQAFSTGVPVETLQRAFDNIYATMDSIDVFKTKALDSMRTTISALEMETDKAQRRLEDHAGADRAETLLTSQ